MTLVSLIGLGSLLGRFAIGGVADRLGRIGLARRDVRRASA